MTITPMPIIIPVGHSNFSGPVPWWMSIFISPILFGMGLMIIFVLKEIIVSYWTPIIEKIIWSIILVPLALVCISLSIAIWWL